MGSVWLLAAWLIAAPIQSPERVERTALEEAVSTAIGGDFETALTLFRQLLDSDPDNPLFSYYVGFTYLQLKEAALAEAYLREAVKREAPFPQAYYWLAKVQVQEKKWEEAEETVGRGLESFPRNEALRTLEASLQHRSNQAPF